MEKIIYGFYQSPFGQMVIAATAKGICWIGFMVEGYKGNGLMRMKEHFPKVDFVRDDAHIFPLGERIMDCWRTGAEKNMVLDLRGTEFQQKVWQALLDIPKGNVCAYGDIANDIGMPNAARAVGSAVGENPVSLIVPCHRVVQKSGALGNYGWGVALKEEILRQEKAANL